MSLLPCVYIGCSESRADKGGVWGGELGNQVASSSYINGGTEPESLAEEPGLDS